jgi:hypothetical protein
MGGPKEKKPAKRLKKGTTRSKGKKLASGVETYINGKARRLSVDPKTGITYLGKTPVSKLTKRKASKK